MLHTESVVDEEGLARLRTARSDIVSERADGTDTWTLDHGPFHEYRRRLDATPAGDGLWTARETITWRLAIPVWGWLFWIPVRRALRDRRDRFGYWWAPPDRLDQRAATVLGLLAGVQIVDGYLGTVLTQTLTFAADEFERGNEAQGWVLGVVRVGVLIALVSAALADRRGRRSLLLATGIASCGFTLLGGLAPNLWVLGGTQLIARGFSTALGILIAVIAVEEMPARSRAWAASVLTLSAGLGSGMAVWVLPLADLDVRGWRAIYIIGGLGAVVVWQVGKRIPETRRFTHQVAPVDDSWEAEQTRLRRRHRLTLLATSAFLLAMFLAPASGFQNDFLKDERGFSGTDISIFTVVTATPIGIGVLLGGYLAETRGRRPVGAFGLLAGAVFAASAYFVDGVQLWLFALAGGILGATAVPALVVYGPELFGTHDRGRSNGLVVTVGVTGSAVGLIFVGQLSERMGEIGPSIAMLGIGPLIVAFLVLTRYPETAARELEEINPEDS